MVSRKIAVTYLLQKHSHTICLPICHRNMVLRRFLPKGNYFDGISEEFLRWVEDCFNNRPMKVLGFKTPNQVWEEELSLVA